MTAPTKIELAGNAQVAPVPAGNLGGPRTEALCLFRLCPWRSTGLPDAPLDVQEAVVARHLLAEHREALRTLGWFAADAGLL